ncbi:cysteine--tRNA ligase [Pendulispora rubella]|uniref:Cysteine--tRNA ligase n=1 Tax=Pendulispora rubella TaxID=2741070 RepID=A0ABZ2L4Z7_9BACT
MRLRNTYTKELETFVPLDPKEKLVTLYSCGPTVYSCAHIGNFRSFLLADVLRRTLELRGFTVRHVMNITDVGHMTEDHLADATGEDKLAKAARELGSDPFEVAAHFERMFAEDARAMGLRNYAPGEAEVDALHPRATGYVPEMLAMVQLLIERGHAYVDREGQVYFAVATFPEYGLLSGKVLDELEAGARVAVRSEKRDPHDFALWKVDPKHLMQWNPHGSAGWRPGERERLARLVPNGIDPRVKSGFPGWHIECSAMSRATLGPAIDVHTGGEDNVFPHHECEIAQSWGARSDDAAPKNFCRYWVHARHLLVNGKKMSKRDGTFITVRDLFNPRAQKRDDLAARLEAAGFTEGRVAPAVLRFALTSIAFGQQMNFTIDALVQARASVERIQSSYARAREIAGDGAASDAVAARVAEGTAEFDAAMDDNLNTARALAEVFGVVSATNQRELSPGDARAVQGFLERADAIFSVLDRRVRSGLFARDELARRAEEAIGEAHLPASPETPPAEAIEALVVHRFGARKRRDFAQADAIRGWLAERGVELEDIAAGGVRWRIR